MLKSTLFPLCLLSLLIATIVAMTSGSENDQPAGSIGIDVPAERNRPPVLARAGGLRSLISTPLRTLTTAVIGAGLVGTALLAAHKGGHGLFKSNPNELAHAGNRINNYSEYRAEREKFEKHNSALRNAHLDGFGKESQKMRENNRRKHASAEEAASKPEKYAEAREKLKNLEAGFGKQVWEMKQHNQRANIAPAPAPAEDLDHIDEEVEPDEKLRENNRRKHELEEGGANEPEKYAEALKKINIEGFGKQPWQMKEKNQRANSAPAEDFDHIENYEKFKKVEENEAERDAVGKHHMAMMGVSNAEYEKAVEKAKLLEREYPNSTYANWKFEQED